MNESMENRSREIERGGNVDWKLVDFLEDSNRKDSSNIDRSIRRRESSGNIWDSKLANWKSGKVESGMVDLNKRRFERCNLTGNQLAMKG